MFYHGRSWLVYAIWAFLLGAMVFALWERAWPMLFIALATLVLSIIPAVVADRYQVRIPVDVFSGLVLFTFATLFLGEAFNFYDRYWWWDMVLHASAAMGFGLVGVIFALVLFEGDRYAAPAWAIAFLAFCLGVTMGTLWEIFEYIMDTAFGLNMQRSGLVDTMWDLIVDAIGALTGAGAGYAYMVGRDRRGLSGVIGEFVRSNRGRLFRKAKPRD